MSYVSCLEDIEKIRADLEHLAGRVPPLASRVHAAPTVFAAAERLLERVWVVLELGTSPDLDLAAELLDERDCAARQEREIDRFRDEVIGLRRAAAVARREATSWRDAFYAATRRPRSMTGAKGGQLVRRH
jgi:hypothetical protein